MSIRAGTYRYMAEADALVVAYAIGAGPAQTVCGDLRWEMMPADFHAHHARVVAGTAVWAAWNAGFDRAAWNYATPDWPLLPPHHIIDVMAQATAAGLPGGLDGAARFSGCGRKAADGKKLIKLFCEQGAEPDFHPAEWQAFLAYAANDVEVMRDVFRRTLQLPLAEWREYWASEMVNQRGVGVDLELARRAAKIAEVDKQVSARELEKLTGGAVTAVTQVGRMVDWLKTVLDAEGRAILTRRAEEVDEETGEIVEPDKLSVDRARIRLLVAQLQNKRRNTLEECALRLLLIRQYGGSTTPAKFTRMLEQNVDGVLLGSYVFNGAPQTGRFSSKGVQIHNLMRDALPYEMDALDAILTGATHGELATLGDSTPVSRKLSMLIRPAIVPTRGEVLVWGDWSQIEARVLPWLAGAEHRLDIFREVDADPTLPDLYTRTAAAMSGVDVSEVTPGMRQRGKVAELALGFCGGKGALQNMAAGYGMHFTDAQAQDQVDRWRDANPWAIDYSRELWEAMRNAQAAPGHGFSAGRIQFVFLPEYLGGTLLCQLPSDRMLTYRGLRWEMVDEIDDKGVVTDYKLELMFSRGYGRIKLWPGFIVENVTQAVAADILRGTIRDLVNDGFDVRAHTHDEILLQTPEAFARPVRLGLQEIMERGFLWSDGLPLRAETTVGRWYSKNRGSYGL